MYDTLKLEKGLYNLSGKSFLQALEEADPSENYEGTPLANLDAFERQLKRFDIKINGINSDFVEKFFSTTESAILFPEFVKRAITQGMQESILSEIVAVNTLSDSNTVTGFSITESTAYDTITYESNSFPETVIKSDSLSSTILKIGRIINASYESIKKQRIDAFAVTLKAIGIKLSNAMTKYAISALIDGTPSIDTIDADFTYADLTNLYGAFTDFDMTTLIASPATVSSLLKLDEMKDCTSKNQKEIILPFGTSLLKSNQIDDTKILAIDKNFALEMITNSELSIETDKLIDRQLEQISVCMNVAFKKIYPDSVKYLEK